jgi:hypothetical protein
MLRDGFVRFCDDPEIACIRAEKALEHLRNVISRIREENRWIPMSERWPEENQRCLIFPIDAEIEVAYLKNGRFHFRDGYSIYPNEVQYWRPLPKNEVNVDGSSYMLFSDEELYQ